MLASTHSLSTIEKKPQEECPRVELEKIANISRFASHIQSHAVLK
jgi:hypothetical protein